MLVVWLVALGVAPLVAVVSAPFVVAAVAVVCVFVATVVVACVLAVDVVVGTAATRIHRRFGRRGEEESLWDCCDLDSKSPWTRMIGSSFSVGY